MDHRARCRHCWKFRFARKVELVILNWRCTECRRIKITQLLPPASPSALSVSLHAFIELLAEARRFDERYPELHQVQWLLTNWSISDEAAHYHPAR